MTVKMNTTIDQERYSWIKPILEKRLTYRDVMKTCPHGRRSLERWVGLYRKKGIGGLDGKTPNGVLFNYPPNVCA